MLINYNRIHFFSFGNYNIYFQHQSGTCYTVHVHVHLKNYVGSVGEIVNKIYIQLISGFESSCLSSIMVAGRSEYLIPFSETPMPGKLHYSLGGATDLPTAPIILLRFRTK